MLKLVSRFVAITAFALLVWQTSVAEPAWARAGIGLLMAVLSLLFGIRIGTNSAAAYTQDLQRLNKVLAEQNRDLQDANAMLVREVNSEAATPPKSTYA
jgi:hypothetical protein